MEHELNSGTKGIFSAELFSSEYFFNGISCKTKYFFRKICFYSILPHRKKEKEIKVRFFILKIEIFYISCVYLFCSHQLLRGGSFFWRRREKLLAWRGPPRCHENKNPEVKKWQFWSAPHPASKKFSHIELLKPPQGVSHQYLALSRKSK